MDIQIFGKDFYVTEGLKAHITEKLEKFDRFQLDKIKISMFTDKNQKIHVTAEASSQVLNVQTQTVQAKDQTTYQTIDAAIKGLSIEVKEQLDKNVAKFHGKRNNHGIVDTIRKADNAYEDEQEAIAEMDEGIY